MGVHVYHRPEPALTSLPTQPLWVISASALALSALLHELNLHWPSILHIVIHISTLVSQIIPPLPSPTESKSLFFIFVSLLLSCI